MTGLAAEFYTHFTSPIRRYADVVVHRLLLKSVDQGILAEAVASPSPSPSPSSAVTAAPALSDQCHHMNVQHRMAKSASDQSQGLFFSLYFRGAGRTVCAAVVSAVRENGIVVFVPQYEVHGNVYLRSREGHAFMPLNDATDGDAKADPTVRVSFEDRHGGGQEGSGQPGKRLLAREQAGGTLAWSVEVFDSIVVAITAEQSKFHLPGLKLTFVKLGTKDMKAPVVTNGKPGKATMGSLKDAVREEQEAKKSRLEHVKRNALEQSRVKAGLPSRAPNGGSRGHVSAVSLYERLHAARPAATAGTSTSNGSASDHVISWPLITPGCPSMAGTALRGRRQVGGHGPKDSVLTLREKQQHEDKAGPLPGRPPSIKPQQEVYTRDFASCDESAPFPAPTEVQQAIFPELGAASVPRETISVKRPLAAPVFAYRTTLQQRALYCHPGVR